jgi:hypothetical protein
MIVADGNRMGEKLQKARFPADPTEAARALGAFSQAVDKCLLHALKDALIVTGKFLGATPVSEDGGTARRCLPIMPLIAGGDDLLLLCQGRWAVPYAAMLLRSFAAKTRETPAITNLIGSEGISMSAGVTISHHKFPLFRLHVIGHELMAEAKLLSSNLHQTIESGCAEKAEYGSLSFLRITSSMFQTLTAEREGRMRKIGAENLIKTACPYVVVSEVKGKEQVAPQGAPEIRTLLKAQEELRKADLPRRRLYRTEEWLDLPDGVRNRTILEETARLNADYRKALREIQESFDCEPLTGGQEARSVWVRNRRPKRNLEHGDPTYESPFPDLVDLEACDV